MIINLVDMPRSNKKRQICPDNFSDALLLLGRLCSDDCIAIIDKKKSISHQQQNPILRAQRFFPIGICATCINDPLLNKVSQNECNALTPNGRCKEHCSDETITEAPGAHPIQVLCDNLQTFVSIERLLFLPGSLGFPRLLALRQAIEATCLIVFQGLNIQGTQNLAGSDIALLGHLDAKQKMITPLNQKL